jgi:hypothetical protein
MPFLSSCLVIGLSAVVHKICPEMVGHGGLRLWLIYVSVACLVLDDPWLERPKGTPTARRSMALINVSGFSGFWAQR